MKPLIPMTIRYINDKVESLPEHMHAKDYRGVPYVWMDRSVMRNSFGKFDENGAYHHFVEYADAGLIYSITYSDGRVELPFRHQPWYEPTMMKIRAILNGFASQGWDYIGLFDWPTQKWNTVYPVSSED